MGTTVAEFLDLNNAKSIYKTFKADKIKNANIIIDLLKILEEAKNRKMLRKSLALIHKIFCQLITDGVINEILVNDSEAEKEPKAKYNQWLYQRYEEAHATLLKIVSNKEVAAPLREIALVAVVRLIQKETQRPATEEQLRGVRFPLRRLTALYGTLLGSEADCGSVIRRMKEFLRCPDFLFFSLHVLARIAPPPGGKQPPLPFPVASLVSVLELVDLPVEGKKPLEAPPLFLTRADEDGDSASSSWPFPHAEARRDLNAVWGAVLRAHLDAGLYKRCLVLLPERVMMHLDDPVTLTDFFMNAYNLGGVSSLLAMHGVYILVTQHNLEYPDFYRKVYALFQPTIFHAKYRARFFVLCNKFFLSPYLPEYVVAAFAKRCSRLALSAPSPCLVLLVKFVVNLLLRYPSLGRLINAPAPLEGLDDDPFLPDEPNPLLCRAGESSLWEVATLVQHPLCGVSKAAGVVAKNLPDVEHDIANFVDKSYADLYQKASKIREPRVATTFQPPEGLFLHPDDAMSSAWDLL